MSTRREAREIARVLALSTQEYAQISLPKNAAPTKDAGATICNLASGKSAGSSGAASGSGSGSADRSRDTDDSREMEIRPVTVNPSEVMRPPDSIIPAWSSSSGNGTENSKRTDESTNQSPIQSFTPSSTAARSAIMPPAAQSAAAPLSSLPPRLQPASFQSPIPGSTPNSEPANRSSEREADTPSAPLFSPTQISARDQRSSPGAQGQGGGTTVGEQVDDDEESIPGSPVQGGEDGKRQFPRFVLSPDPDEEEEIEPIERREQVSRAESRVGNMADADKEEVGPGRVQVEVVLPRSASTSKVPPAAAEAGSLIPDNKAATSAPATAIPSRTDGPAFKTPTTKRKRSPDPLAMSPVRPTASRPAAPTPAPPTASASSSVLASGSTAGPAATSSSRRKSTTTTTPVARVSKRQADHKAKEEAEKEAKRLKKLAEREKRAKEKAEEEERLRKELEGGEVVKKQPSRAERSAGRSGSRVVHSPEASRRSARGQPTVQEGRRERGRSDSAARGELEGQPVTELQSDDESGAEGNPGPVKAASARGSRADSRLRSHSPALTKGSKTLPPVVRQYGKRGQAVPPKAAGLNERDQASDIVVTDDDDVVEVLPSAKRATPSNKRQKTAPSTMTKSVTSSSTPGKGRSLPIRGKKRVASDDESEEDGEHGSDGEQGDEDEDEDEEQVIGNKTGSKGRSKAPGPSKGKSAPAKKSKKVVSEDEDADAAGDEDVPSRSGASDSESHAGMDQSAAKDSTVDEARAQTPKSSKETSPPAGSTEGLPPKRSPLQALPTGVNTASAVVASPIAGPSKPATTAPGGVKWRTQRGDLANVLAKFGGHKSLGMSRRTKIVPLHQTIGPPKKALPPAPKKAERKKKGESDDDDEDDDELYESDGEGGRRKKPKEKDMEWFMMED